MNFILLAAGRGQRMGSNKSLMLFHGEPWVQFQIRQIEEAGFHEILLVTNPESAEALEEITGKHTHVKIFINPDPMRGPFSSLQIALKENGDHAAFVSPIDAPLKATTLKIMMEAWLRLENIDALIPSYKDRKGHPIILSSELQRRLQKKPLEEKDSRLDMILHQLPVNKKKILTLEDPFIPLNLNTPEDLAALSWTT
jgi:molybdenum cofactor cytidylyltransferase